MFLRTLRSFLACLDGRAFLAPEFPVAQIVRAERPEWLEVLIDYLDFLGAFPSELAGTAGAGTVLSQVHLRKLPPGKRLAFFWKLPSAIRQRSLRQDLPGLLWRIGEPHEEQAHRA